MSVNLGVLYRDTGCLADADKAFSEADVVSEGLYGSNVITHCCLESHGSTAEWPDKDHLFVHISTQNVSGVPSQMAEPLGVPAANVRVHQDHVGGGFGSKFSADRWDITAAKLSRKARGKPVRLMLERDAELQVAGARPSAYARVKLGAKKDGTITAWQSQSWGSPVAAPYSSYRSLTSVSSAPGTELKPGRAILYPWRAPLVSPSA